MIREELCLHFQPSILAEPARIGLRKAKDSFVHQKTTSYDIPLQRVLIQQLPLLAQLDQLAIQGNRGFLHAQKESFLFLNAALAQHLSLDLIFSVPVRQCTKRRFKTFPYQSEKLRKGSRLSLSCDNSGEASIPKFDLSSTSDTARVVTMSSPDL